MTKPQDSSTHILLFLKAPVPGAVKTRLAQTLGAATAVEIYRQLVGTQLERLPDKCTLEIHYAPADAAAAFSEWLGHDHHYYPQPDTGNLGERIEHAISGAFQRGARTVLCIGGDCPSLHPQHLEEADEQLRSGQSDLVLGPSPDGGYYLIGLREAHPQLFKHIRWSSVHTMDDTLRNAKSIGLRTHSLEAMNDIDTIDDLLAAIAQEHLPPTCLPPEFAPKSRTT